ncbi:hypothetical protein TOPH_04850 [Tolypocladium ophioglossoides CBS 100239]|uniref:Uncharacterized protein n=1 Tax=Tolypocladium ophioglossoides (strain CBS 100239) TaxID=1163406 RepID=A0A0L0NA85_TOLOC|nr:hypothetical protein TOPH_04850 [Tolypocladium ophioglossoides CBS 100239]
MCEGKTFAYYCPCGAPNCPRRGVLGDGRKGHVLQRHEDGTGWIYCDWWFANAPPELALNRYVKPAACPCLTMRTIYVELGVCGPCMAECGRPAGQR